MTQKIEAPFEHDELYLFEKFKSEYWSWSHMKNRCYNRKSKDFKFYGARGISVCDRWRNSFKNFLQDMGLRPHGMSLDRVDNNGHYAPENCRWATRIEQCNNQRSNRLVEFRGQTVTIAEWARRTGFRELTIWSRLTKFGWPIHLALTVPPKCGNRHKYNEANYSAE